MNIYRATDLKWLKKSNHISSSFQLPARISNASLIFVIKPSNYIHHCALIFRYPDVSRIRSIVHRMSEFRNVDCSIFVLRNWNLLFAKILTLQSRFHRRSTFLTYQFISSKIKANVCFHMHNLFFIRCEKGFEYNKDGNIDWVNGWVRISFCFCLWLRVDCGKDGHSTSDGVMHIKFRFFVDEIYIYYSLWLYVLHSITTVQQLILHLIVRSQRGDDTKHIAYQRLCDRCVVATSMFLLLSCQSEICIFYYTCNTIMNTY